ncbi:hypothetical protein DCAR_0206728 [Daucus carota subsp. sativus]|uniref:Uncharacterized protein n=1 Tax=Daucus carota subsp. sativus TaxID=79200 RepID=A0A161Y6U5_DAUCS|nr:hypothetical protein DCAR_0206728 [Daucus carota subsp. sativus]
MSLASSQPDIKIWILDISEVLPHMNFALPRESLAGSVIERTGSLVTDLNVICTTLNFVTQNIILMLKIKYPINELPKFLDWITLAAAIVSCVGTIASLIKYNNRPLHKGRWFNFFVALALVALTGLSLAVHSDPRVFTLAVSTVSSGLLSVTNANSQRKERCFLLGAKRVPIAILRIEDNVISYLQVSEEDIHLVDPLYQAGRNVAFSVSTGEGVMTECKMREA